MATTTTTTTTTTEKEDGSQSETTQNTLPSKRKAKAVSVCGDVGVKQCCCTREEAAF